MAELDPRARINLGLALLVALLLALSLLTAVVPEPPPERLGGPTAEQVVAIRVERADGLRFELHRSASGWEYRDAGGVRPARDDAGDTLATLGDSPSLAVYPLDSIDPASAGLEPPRARVWLDAAEYRIGAQEPIAYRRFVQAGQRVHLLTDIHYRYIMATRDALVAPEE